MRDYGKVYTAFWTSEDARNLSEDGRMLALYLMTCPHGNMLGTFRLSDAYAADDLQWDIERVRKGFVELLAKRFAYRCERTFWVFIRQYLKWNQFENPNVGLAAGKMFDGLACPNMVKALLCAALREFAPRFPAKKLEEFETLIEPFDNPFGLNTKTRTRTRARATTGTTTGAEAGTNIVDQTPVDVSADPVQTIFAYWQKIMKTPGSVMDEKRKKLITTALRTYSPEDVCHAIRGCSRSPWNMGDNPQRVKYNGLNLILRSAEYIERFIGLSKQEATGPETVEEANARALRELEEMGSRDVADDPNIIDMEPTP